MSEDINVTDGTVLEALNNKVDLDGGNYIGSGLEDVVEETHWSKKITNCLLEVPQRIKLELNNGVLTLKSGSEVIVPNGFEADGTTPKFDYLTTTNDLSLNTTYNDTRTWVINSTLKGYEALPIDTCCFSGTTAPTSYQWMLWYDTGTNKIKTTSDYGATWIESFSLPVCIFSGTNVPTRIDQVFNGVGFIGSTVWVDKGVKGLIPNGRNEDGTLKNIEHTRTSIGFLTAEYTNTFNVVIDLSKNNGLFLPTASTIGNTRYYDIESNYWYVGATNGVGGEKAQWCVLGTTTTDANKNIISFNPKQPFRVPDNQDVVQKAGDTMTGRLDIIAPQGTHLGLRSQFQDVNVTPTAAQHDNYLDLIDKNGTLMGRIYSEISTDRTVCLGLQTWNGSTCGQFFLFAHPNGKTSYYPYQLIEAYGSGMSGYCIWSNGYCEQWGNSTVQGNRNVTLFKTYAHAPVITATSVDSGNTYVCTDSANMPNNAIHLKPSATNRVISISWKTCGYLAAGQY